MDIRRQQMNGQRRCGMCICMHIYIYIYIYTYIYLNAHIHNGILSSIQVSSSVVSDSLRPREQNHARPLCPLPTPGVHPNACPSSWWCHPIISSSVVPFSSCHQSFIASGSFQMSQLFASGGQSTGVSASTLVLPMNTQDWAPFKSLLQHHNSKSSILQHSAFFIVQLSHPYMTTGKTIALTRRTFVGKVMSLLFNMLSRLVVTFLPRSKHLLISWLQSPSAVILEPRKIKSATVYTVSPSSCHKVMGPDAMILVFWECYSSIKQWNFAICNNMDRIGGYDTK